MASPRASESSEMSVPLGTGLTSFQGGRRHRRPADIPAPSGHSARLCPLGAPQSQSLPWAGGSPPVGGDDPCIRVPDFVSLSLATALGPQDSGREGHLALSRHTGTRLGFGE